MATLGFGGRALMPRPLLAALALVWLWPVGQAATAEQLLTGVVAIDHGDDFANRTSGEYPMLEVGGERLALRNVSADDVTVGMRVSVRGHRVGDTVYVDRGGIVPAEPDVALAAGTTAASTMTKRVAVLMVNFVAPTPSPTPPPTDPPPTPPPTDPPPTDTPTPIDSAQPPETPLPTDTPRPTDTPAPTSAPTPSPSPSPSPTPPPPPPQPWTADFVRGVYFTNTRSVADYYDEISDGRMSVTGDVFGWFTVPADTSACNHRDWGDAARAAATAAGIDLSAYTNVAVVFPKQAVCWWVGMAQLPGRNTYVNGSAGWSYATWLFTATHELGHNFGMNHASTLSCTNGGVRVAFSDNCSLDEYGDPFDTMGGNGQRHFNTWHRWQLGLLGASDVQTVTTSGVYRVATAEVTGGVPRVLRVTRPSGNYYYLEFRQPYGSYDNFATTAPVVNGVSIRIAAGVGSLSFSKLIDTNPQTNTFSDAALGVGRGFADNINDIYVVTQAISPTGATVLVHVGPDLVPPGAPPGVQATSDANGAVNMTWKLATDDVFVAGYQVARDGAVIGNTGASSFTDNGLPQAITYGYSVSAVDAAGNVGPPTDVSIYLPDITPPGRPTTVTATATGPHSVAIGWAAAHDNVAVTSYQVSRNGTALGSTSGTTFEDNAAPDELSLTYQVRALDAAGNIGPAAGANVQPTDVTAPVLAGTLTMTVYAAGTVSLSWPAATDNVRVAGYSLSRDGAPVAVVSSPSFADAGLGQARTYQYDVVALDMAGNASGPLHGSIYLPDVSAPSTPGTLSAQPAGSRAVNLAWGAATDNVAVDHYAVFVDGGLVATTANTSLTNLAVSDGVKHRFAVWAVDTAGNVGPAVTAYLTLPDATAPGAPGSLRALASGATSVALSWTAASDNVAVVAYRLTRNGVPLPNIDGSATGLGDASLATDQTYTYALTAVDAAGNVGPTVTAQVKLVSVDVTPPSVPLNLSGIALGGRRISLTWSRSSDDRPGTIRYKVFRGRKRIAIVTSTSFVARPSTVGWYKFRVKAVDAAGNVSSFSVAVWVKALP